MLSHKKTILTLMEAVFHILVPYINVGILGRKFLFFYRSQWGKIEVLDQKYNFCNYFFSATHYFCNYPFFFFSSLILLMGGQGYMMMDHVKYHVVFFSCVISSSCKFPIRNNSLTYCTQVMQVQTWEGLQNVSAIPDVYK
jgi:hypothetical protein